MTDEEHRTLMEIRQSLSKLHGRFTEEEYGTDWLAQAPTRVEKKVDTLQRSLQRLEQANGVHALAQQDEEGAGLPT